METLTEACEQEVLQVNSGHPLKAAWSKETVLQLIDDLKEYPILLYNRQVQDPLKVRDVLAILARKYQVVPEEINAKVHVLKSQFRREQRKIKKAKSSNMPIRNVWFGYNRMLLLFLGNLQSAETNGGHDVHVIDKHTTLEIAPSPAVEVVNYSRRKPAQSLKVEVVEEHCLDEEHFEPQEGIEIQMCDENASQNNDTGAAQSQESVLDSSCSESPPAAKETKETRASSYAYRDQFDVYGEHIAYKLRNSERSHLEIATAQHYIDNILFNLITGEYAKKSAT